MSFIYQRQTGQKQLQYMGTLDAELRSYYFAPVSSAKRPLNYISLFPLCLSLRCFGHNRGHDFSCPLRERLTMRTVNCSKTSEHDVVLAEKKKYQEHSWKNSSLDQASYSQHCECGHEPNTEGSESRALYFWAVLCFLCGHKTKVQAEQSQITARPLSSFFYFRNPRYEPSPLPSGSLLLQVALSSSHQPPWHAGDGKNPLVLTELSDQHLSKPSWRNSTDKKRSGIIFGELANPPVRVYFLYDPVSGLKEQDPTVPFRIPASLMNTLVLFLMKLFGECKPCASTFAPIDLTCVPSGQ